MKTRILTFTLSIFLCAAARAELKWEQNTIDLHPAIGDKTAVAHFKYQNTGTTPVHFKSVKASCGCTTTQSQKEVVNPGEKGEIIATFNIGDRTGQQMKTVTVQTDDPNPTQATTILTLKATIPQALEIKPAFVYWQSGEEPKPKKISIKVSKDFPAKNITAKSNGQMFESKVEQGSAPGEWVRYQPASRHFSILAPSDGVELSYPVLDGQTKVVELHYVIGNNNGNLYVMMWAKGSNDDATDASAAAVVSSRS